MGLFGAAHAWGTKRPPSRKSDTHISNDETWHSYTLPKEDPKNIWITWHTPWVLVSLAFFHRKSANFAISENTDIDCILVHNFFLFLTFFESLKTFFINMGAILIMSAKLLTPGRLKIKIFQKIGCDVIIPDYDVTNKMLLWEKLS